MRETTYDVVIYGASGFVGKQTVRYFAEHAGDELRWAIAGRDRQKLELVRAEVVDFDRLPGGAQRGGVLTPATGLGDVLLERLRKAGMQIEVEMV